MPFENAQYISELVDTNPLDNDPVNQGDDHLRSIKLALQANVLGDDTITQLLVNNLPAAQVSRPVGTEFPALDLLGETGAKKAGLGNIAGNDSLLLDNDITGAVIALRGNAGAVTLFQGDPAGSSIMYNAGDPVFTVEDGSIRADRVGTGSMTLSLESAGVRSASLLGDPSGPTILRSNATLRAVQLQASDGGGAPVLILSGDPNANTTLYNVGVEVFRTSAAGVNVVRGGAGSPNMGFNNDAGTIAQIVANDAGDSQFTALRTSRGIQLRGTNSGGSIITMITLDPNVASYMRGPDNTNHLTVNNSGIVVNGQVNISDLVPTNSAHATRKDYVDGIGNSGFVQHKVGNVSIMAGSQTAVGTTVTVTYPDPFTSVPFVTVIGVAATLVQTRLITSTTTGFTAQVSVSGAGLNWQAMGVDTS